MSSDVATAEEELEDQTEEHAYVAETELPLDCPKCKKFAPAWMTTFADMSTLLMALFAILYSFAEQDEKSKALMLGSLNAQFGATVIVPTIDMPIAQSIIFSDTKSVNDKNLKEISEDEAKQAKQNFLSLKQTLAEEITKGEVIVRQAANKVIVELLSFSSKDTATEDYYLTQSVLEISKKVLLAQAQMTTAIEVRKQDLAALEAIKQRRKEDAENQYQNMAADFAAEVKSGALELELKEENLIMRLPGEGSFVSGSATLQPGFKDLVMRIGEKLKISRGRIRIEGHTDNVKIAFSDQFRSNWDLSSARSGSVSSVFLKDQGIEIDRVVVAGFADSVPLESNDTPEGRSRNRRIEIIVRGF
jgi:chemotaxis protein MotB